MVAVDWLEIGAQSSLLLGSVAEREVLRIVFDEEVQGHGLVELDLQRARNGQVGDLLGAEDGDSEHILEEFAAPGERRRRGDVERRRRRYAGRAPHGGAGGA